MQWSLLPEPLPPGLQYSPDFISVAEEEFLLKEIKTLKWQRYQYGEFLANRKIAAFGMEDKAALGHTDPVPHFILPIKARIAEKFAVKNEEITAVLFTHYPKGAAIGWHADQPMYEKVFGISLLTDCTMDFRLKRGNDFEYARAALEARSVYAMLGPSRRPWQHRIEALDADRYSITFRTLQSR